jgi:hypothetical protein
MTWLAALSAYSKQMRSNKNTVNNTTTDSWKGRHGPILDDADIRLQECKAIHSSTGLNNKLEFYIKQELLLNPSKHSGNYTYHLL